MRLRTGDQVKDIPPDFQILTTVVGQIPVGVVGEVLQSGFASGRMCVRQGGHAVARIVTVQLSLQ